MKRKLFILITGFLILFPGAVFSQKYHTNSSRALRAYDQGKQEYDFFFFDKAEASLKDAIQADNRFYEAYMLLGEMMYKLKHYNESAQYYQQAVRIDSLFYRPVFFELATAELLSGNYIRARIHFKVYLEQKDASEKNIYSALEGMKKCEFAIDAIKKPVPFTPVSIGDSINTADDEYWPSITADGQTLMFTRQGRGSRSPSGNQEDFYISHLVNNVWSKAQNAGKPLNTRHNEGAQSISADGRYMYFTACERPDGYGRCDIYYTTSDGSTWSEPVNIGPPVNTQYWESLPSISANGEMLFFVSNRPGGIGGMDLWYSVLNSEGKWGLPKNLGPMINTPGNEMSPFIHFDGKTLYFSSDGRIGMGGYDIYYSKMNDDSTWTEPKNLGYPINTYNDEMGLIIDASGLMAYFSTFRDQNKGKDIYYFPLYESVRPDPVSYFRGRVYDSETGKLLNAEYELIKLKTAQVIASGATDNSGSFLVCLPSGFNYGLNVNKSGYLFYSDNFMFEGIHSASEPFNKRILLKPIKVGEAIQLANIFYEFDSWELKKESIAELDRLYKLLNENTTIFVEIGGYTDSIGTNEYNLSLSERRARSVVSYLTDKGINKKRMTSRGYGASSPIGNNITDEGRKLNRRTEVKVTGKE
jgi:flagellar motor protein MotB